MEESLLTKDHSSQGANTSRNQEERNWSELEWNDAWISSPRYALPIILLYIIAGSVVLYFLEKDTDQPLDLVTSVYFASVTLSTVGYGDFHPQTDMGKLVICLYIMIGLSFIASAISTIADAAFDSANEITEDDEHKQIAERQVTGLHSPRSESGNADEDAGTCEDEEVHHPTARWKERRCWQWGIRMASPLLGFFSLAFLGTVFVHYNEVVKEVKYVALF